MCIAILSTAHPSYSLVLIDNRDEYLNRPTAPAGWWPSQKPFVLSGRDLLRPEQGTWLGITKAGRVAVLTNFREDVTPPPSAVSRGAIIKNFLLEEEDFGGGTKEWVKEMVDSGMGRHVGGFSLVCGRLEAGSGEIEKKGLAVFSNRVKVEGDLEWVFGEGSQKKHIGLSNAAFGDSGWRKIEDGEELLETAIIESQASGETEDQFIQRLLGILSRDTLPLHHDSEVGLETYIGEMRHSIFVPMVGRKETSNVQPDEVAAAKTNEKAEIVDEKQNRLGVSGLYGTHQQTVLLVDRAGKVRYFERTLYDNESNPVPVGESDVDINFQIEN